MIIKMENIWEYKMYVPYIVLVYLISLVPSVSCEYCTSTKNGQQTYIQCDYGCCGSTADRSCCSISTAVLIVACVISGLIVVALVAAIVICCYKKYKDKQNSRVRTLRQEQQAQQVMRRNVEPPKPPSYTNKPPEYSEEMPESHYRPITVAGRTTPSNQRFDGRRHFHNTRHNNAPITRNSDMFSRHHVAVTNTSGIAPTSVPASNSFQSNNSQTLPGSAMNEPPPPYSEFIRGQTPANRRQHARAQQTRVQSTLTEESRTPSSRGSSETRTNTNSLRTETRTTTQTDNTVNAQTQSNSSISEAPPVYAQVPPRTRGRGTQSRGTRMTLHGAERPVTDDPELDTLTIV